MFTGTPNQNAPPPQPGNPGAALMANALGGGGQPAQPQFAPQFTPPQLNVPQLMQPQQSGGFTPPQLNLPAMQPQQVQPQQQYMPAPTPQLMPQSQFLQPQAPQQLPQPAPYPGIINPMPQFPSPQQVQPQYVPPFPVAPQPMQQPQQFAPQQVPAQLFGSPPWMPPQAASAGPSPLAGMRPAQPANGIQTPQQLAPQQLATQQQQFEIQRLQNDLAQMHQQLRAAQQPQSGQQVQQQPQQVQPPAPRFDLEHWPEADSIMFGEWRETRQLQDGRTVTDWKPNTPVNVRMAGDQYLQHLANWESSLLYAPHKVLPELIERHAAKIAEKIVNDRVNASENSTRVDILLGQNDWLFVTDPVSGQMTLNDYGRKMVNLAQYQPGKAQVTADDVRNLEYALQQVRLERERDDLRRQLSQVQSGGQWPQLPGMQPMAGMMPAPQLNAGLPPGVMPMYAPVPMLPGYQHPATAQYPQQPPLGQAANTAINQRLNQLDRMAQNQASRTGSMMQPTQLPSQQPQQNGHLTAGQKLMNNMRFGQQMYNGAAV